MMPGLVKRKTILITAKVSDIALGCLFWLNKGDQAEVGRSAGSSPSRYVTDRRTPSRLLDC